MRTKTTSYSLTVSLYNTVAVYCPVNWPIRVTRAWRRFEVTALDKYGYVGAICKKELYMI